MLSRLLAPLRSLRVANKLLLISVSLLLPLLVLLYFTVQRINADIDFARHEQAGVAVQGPTRVNPMSFWSGPPAAGPPFEARL